MVWEAYQLVRANRGAAGVDDETIAMFEQNLSGNLYKLWNRMSSGSYFPPPVKQVEIPKAKGGTRKLGVPTVSDRVAQSVAKLMIEPVLDPIFHTGVSSKDRLDNGNRMTPECHVRFCERFGAKLPGPTYHLYRAVDKDGKSVDFLLRAHRDETAARRYFEKAIDQNGAPETVTVDKSGANLAALKTINAKRETPIKIRQNKYLNNVVEQDHRAIKRIVKPIMGFKNFRCARIILSGIEVMHMIRKDR
jgi:hypothetical protein